VSEDSDRWRRLDALLEQAMDLPSDEQRAWLDRACGDDVGLRRDLESLLAHDLPESFLDRPATDEAARLLTPTEPPSLAGRRVGPFEIERSIGHGGMGEVYAARDTRLGRRVAVKRLPARVAGDPETARRFRREALAASALNHPNILTVYEVVERDEGDLLVTELIEGMTVRERLADGPLSLAAALDIVLPAARGLAAAHAAGIVHRDVKPENLMIRDDGLVKIVDFGIAKPVDGALDDAATATGTDRIVGTLGYMSPEQARGLAVDPRTDVWSLGVVLYEAVTGEHPFAGATATDRLAAILERAPEPPSRHRPELPRGLDRFLTRALAKAREERPADAAEFAAELDALRLGNGRESVAAAPRSSMVRVGAVALAALAAAALAWWASLDSGLRSEGAPRIVSLAVLPLDERPDSGDAGYLGTGISQSLTRSLARAPGLRVLASSSVPQVGAAPRSSRDAGRQLGVAAVVAGNVEVRPSGLQIAVELVDTRDGRLLWSASYDRPVEELPGVHEEIAGDLLRHLRLESASVAPAARRPSSEAYRLYLQGTYQWHRAWSEVNPFLKLGAAAWESYERSRDYFQRAVEADPEFGLAWSGLAHYWAYGAANGLLDPEEAWPRAEHTARRALELDATLADVHNTLAALALYRDRDWAGGEREFVTALELGGSAEVLIHYSYFARSLGRAEESLRLIRRALDVDPLSLRANLGQAASLLALGQLDEALAQTRHCLDLEPGSPVTHELLADLLVAMGREAESIAALAASLRLQGDEASARRLQDTHERAGYAEATAELARHRIAQIESARASGLRSPAIFLARGHLLAGDRPRALAWALRALDERNRFVIELATSPLFAPLREEPELRDRIRQLGLPLPHSP